MDLVERINRQFADNIELTTRVMHELSPGIAHAAERIVSCLMADGKLLACGNGTSAADAQRFASLLLNRFERERPGLAAFALASDATTLAAIAEDYDFDLVYSKQVRAIGQPNDLLLAISASGSAANVVEAIHAAHERQMGVIALSAEGGLVGDVLTSEDVHLSIADGHPPRVREIHMLTLHALCDAIDCMLLGAD
ncbi:SIS domain-containing protein [Chitinivorax sp. B]|uniref:SIS domain-containing protein n=1 Tax=Chitinivorax sp. B TaxID=2502235 RepID=UPI0010F51CB3|nr:SIS domain-containing protein [Chitinivorax sp. B]